MERSLHNRLDIGAPPKESFATKWLSIRSHISRYLAILRRRWWVLFLCIALGLAAAAAVVSQMPPEFRSVARMMVSGKLNLADQTQYTEEFANFFGTQVELMQSGEVQRRAKERVQLLNPQLRVDPDVRLNVGQVPRTSIFILTAVGETPEYTKAYLNAVMEAYMGVRREIRSEKSETTTAAIVSELSQMEKQLQQGEDELLGYQKENNIAFLQEEGASAASYIAQLNRDLATLKTEHRLLESLDLDQNLDRVTQQSPESIEGAAQATFDQFGPIADYRKAKGELQVLQAEREERSRYLRPRHPFIVELDRQISRLQNLIESFRGQSHEMLKNRRETLRLQIDNLEQVIAQWDEKALDLSRRIAEYDKIKSRIERNKHQYERLLSNLRSLDVTQKVDQEMVTVLEQATEPQSVKPGLIKVMSLGFAGGTLLGLALLFLLAQLDDRITSLTEIRLHFREHVLGHIPKEDTSDEPPLLKLNDERHALFESFRTLRSSIFFLPVEGVRPKTLLLTSSAPGEGKTTVTSNLALAMAFAGSKTLLIDADLRHGNIHEIFGLRNDRGLSSVMRQTSHWTETVLATNYENLSIIPRGKILEHPSEYFLSRITDNLLREVYDQYDYIILDTAPVIVADDTLSLAPKIDGVIFLIRISTSSSRLSMRGIELLSHRQANILGIVCNDVSLSEVEYGYAYQKYPDYYKVPAAEEA
jgi:polysaccharide biosynthesis transport protein